MSRLAYKRSVLLAVLSVCANRTYATLYTDLLGSQATIDSAGDIVQGGKTYQVEFKPTPPTSNIHYPWISTNGGYTSNNAIGYEIDPSPSGDTSTTDKVDDRVSHADDSTGLGFDSVKYLGFALNIPAANFGAQVIGQGRAGVQIAQWWQGSPYSPPLALDLTGISNGQATWELTAHNDTTLGNPSSIPVIIADGTIPFDSWNTFVVETDMDYNGSGEVALWENGTKLVDWTGAVGYDPSTVPYKNPPQGTADPNQKFDVFIGPYRPIQNTQQVELFDDVRWANTLADATPVPQATVTLSPTSSLSVVSDGDIGGSLSSSLLFSGGTLAVTTSFTTGRAVTIGAGGGTLDVAPGTTFGVGNSLAWLGGTLNTVDSGTVAISLANSTVSVASGSTLNIGSGSKVVVNGSIDPFTDSTNANQHVAITDNGSLAITGVNSTINGITGTGSLTIGDGVNANTVQFATNSGGSSIGSLAILGNSTFDITNNHLFIYYSGSDPIASIAAEVKAGYHGGQWNGRGIISSTAAATSGYGIGYADAADAGNPAGLSAGTIEIKYTLLGDADLNGIVNGVDFGIVAANFNQSASSWDQGDFDYNGIVNGIDFGNIATNFNRGTSGADAADFAALEAFAAANGLLADVPEPATAGLTIVGAVGILAQRRRRRQTI